MKHLFKRMSMFYSTNPRECFTPTCKCQYNHCVIIRCSHLDIYPMDVVHIVAAATTVGVLV